MEHEYWEERLHGFVDKELEPADHAAVENHVRSCPDCQAEITYFRAMKKRVQAHRDSIEMPAAVAERIQNALAKRRNPWRRRYLPMLAVAAMAAALLLFLVLPKKQIGPMLAQIICYDCTVAVKNNLNPSALCKGEHRIGLDVDGRLYRVVSEEDGPKIGAEGLHHGWAEIEGTFIEADRLVIIRSLKPVAGPQQTGLYLPGSQRAAIR